MAGMEIDRDARVMASDGEVGRVTHVVVDRQTREVTEIVVDQDGREMLIPIGAVASADGKTVRLRGTRSQAQAGAFNRDEFHGVDDDTADAESQGTARRGGAPLRDAREDAVVIDAVQGAAAPTRQSAQPRREELVRRQPARQATEGEIHVPVAEERLSVEKRAAELGEVEVRKTVVTEQQSVPVELEREQVEVRERDIADRPLRAGEDAFREGTIRVPVRGEEAVVSKEAVVTGEVAIDKERVTERQQVSDTVRKERVEVEENVVQEGTRGQVRRERGTRQ